MTKELAQCETNVGDLEDRIEAKDQIIRSLESQVDFLKKRIKTDGQTMVEPAPV